MDAFRNAVHFVKYLFLNNILKDGFFSECTKGFYGQDCILTCNAKCDGCNNVNGYCDRGCNPGWKEDNCQQRNVFT